MPAAPVQFAYRVPDVSGGLVTRRIEQRTDRGYEYNRELAALTEDYGFDYALSQVGYGAEYQHRGGNSTAARQMAARVSDRYFSNGKYVGRRVLPLVRELEAGLPEPRPGSVPAHA